MDMEIGANLKDVIKLLKKNGFNITKIKEDKLIEGKLVKRIGRFHILGEKVADKVYLDLHWDFYLHIGPLGVDYGKKPMTVYKSIERCANKMNMDCRIVGGMNWFSKMNVSRIGTKIRIGSVIIALYGFACIFLQFFTHVLEVMILKPLYHNVKDSLRPEELSSIDWTTNCQLSVIDGAICGVVTRIIVASLIYLITDFGARKGELSMTTLRRHLIGLILFVSYLSVFSFTAYSKDPHLLGGVEMVFTIIIAGLLWLISSSYILTFRKRKPFFDYDLELKYLEKDYESNKMSVTIGLSAIIAILVSHLYLIMDQYSSIPKVISGSKQFFSYFLLNGTLYILIYVGFFIGVIVQRLWINDKIVERIKHIDTEKRILKLLQESNDRISTNQILDTLRSKDKESRRFYVNAISRLIEDDKITEDDGDLFL